MMCEKKRCSVIENNDDCFSVANIIIPGKAAMIIETVIRIVFIIFSTGGSPNTFRYFPLKLTL